MLIPHLTYSLFKKAKPIFGAIILVGAALFGLDARADVVYLQNGGSVEGIIRKDEDTSIEMDIGFGSVTFWKGEIKKIERSTPKEVYEIKKGWRTKKKELKKKEDEFYKAREKRFAEYARWSEEERARKMKETGEPNEIKISRDLNSRSILVDALIDEKVKATLVLDTGASLVVLSNRIGQELGIDLTGTGKNSVVTLQLPGNRKLTAMLTVLKSVSIQNVEVKDVMAAIVLEDTQDPAFKDGLLGMTFLNKFNLKIDLKNMKVVLEKIG